MQATNELKMLDKHLLIPEETVKAITKANKINFKGMVKHFHSRIDDLEQEMNFNVKLEMNPEKREQLRTNLNELIGVRNRNESKSASYQNKSRNYPKESRTKDKAIKGSRQVAASPYQVNPQQLSADRLLQQTSFRIQVDNFFKGDPFLHFFEVTNSSLHKINISEIRQG